MSLDRRKLLQLAPCAMLPALPITFPLAGASKTMRGDSNAIDAGGATVTGEGRRENDSQSNSVGAASSTPDSDAAVRKALKFLQRTVNRDGGLGVDVARDSDIGCSAMAGLALMAYGTTPLEGKYNPMLRKIRKFLLRKVDNMPAVDITADTRTQLQNKIGRHAHSFFAALFLSQVMGMSSNSELIKDYFRRLVDVITRSQHQQGHWGTSSWAPMLGNVMGWVSLRAADAAGLAVQGTPERTANYLIGQMRKNLGNRSGGWMHQLYKNATGIRVLYAMNMEDEAVAKRAFKEALRLVTRDNTPFSQAGGEEFLAFHLITETMLKKGGADWDKWYTVVRDKLLDVQNRDGSWTGHHCITSRTFCTAAAVLVLTAPYRYLPISQA